MTGIPDKPDKLEEPIVVTVQESCKHDGTTYLVNLGSYGTGFASVYCCECGVYLREYNAY